jgi:hypothetical protein
MMIKYKISNYYNFFLTNRHRFVKPLLFVILLLSLVTGAGYRAIYIKNNYEVNGGFEFFVNMASHFWSNPGGYNFEDSIRMKENPEDYVFSRHPGRHVTGSFENEKGWAFILSIILKEGSKGIHNLAQTVVNYQFMLDLLVIILLFYAGRSIAGPLGGSLVAILYALFIPSISMMGWVSYYYWAIPFSALSLFFWTTIYRPESRYYSIRHASVLFFLYGCLIGFATSVRLAFLFLPLFMIPLIFLRERNLIRERDFKRAIVLSAAMLIGQGVMLIPQFLITHKYYGEYTLSTRGKWHHVISGFGVYPNPWGIKDSGDLTAVNWAINNGGPDLNKSGIQEYDNFMKMKSLMLIREHPEIFWENIKTNLLSGITLTPIIGYIKRPHFSGTIDNRMSSNILRFALFPPCLLLFCVFIYFFFYRKHFWLLMSAVLQGFYIIAILGMYFPPVAVHTTAYFPVFVLLLGCAIAVLTKVLLAMPEGAIRCWVNKQGFKYWPVRVKESFIEDWDKEYCSTIGERDEHIGSCRKKIKWLIVALVIFFLVLMVNLFMAKAWKNTLSKRSWDCQTIQLVNGSFEKWSKGANSPPDGWGFLPSNAEESEIRRATGEGKVQSGVSAVEVRAGGSSSSFLFFHITSDQLYYLIGRTITVEGWVKSDNKKSNKVYFEILNCIDTSRYPRSYYQNSGNWEKLTLTYKVPDNIKRMSIRLKINNEADASAYFDGVSMRY